ncbi:hypothetical protein BCT75_04350 [Vibrio lentus]|uniref:VirB4 family type IV secretion/conjugal transfer ATPase n=1 Tax=Vibrio lentus TaxID=136468 RepID=UPI000C81972C|nr:hypothetical protein [Vibrio lentus]PML45620.1 hypothetical protein BCT75_04350 [Vibrio lentus]
MGYAKNLYQKLREVPKLTEMFPLMYVKGDHTVIAKDGSHIAILELDGLDYTGMNHDQYDLLYNVRKRLFEKESAFYRLDIVSKKNRISAKDKIKIQTDNQLLGMINKAWQNNFDVAYRTKHYVVISVNSGGLMSKVGALVSDDYNIDKQTLLDELIQEIKVELEEYNPNLLQNGELSSYFATQLNGRETVLNAKHWDQPISNQPVQFDSKLNYCTYGRHGDTIYSSWLSISRYSEEIKNDTLERVFKLPYRFNVFQSFKTIPKAQALALMDEEYKRLMNFGGDNDYFTNELIEFSEKVSADKTTLVSHSFCLEILADSEAELNTVTRIIKGALEQDGQMMLYRENRNLEALFWSRFPTMQGFNLRNRNLSSENAAHLASFNRVGEGFDTCGFGDRPVTIFKTEEGGQFSFTFHQTGEQKNDVLGHTLVLGDTNAGKTTLISFLIANCLSFTNFKAICFDRLHGLKVFTELFDGDYLNFPDDVQMNPFQMADTPENRMFLTTWLKRLGKIPEEDNRFNDRLNQLVNTNFEMDKADRCFEQLAIALGLEGGELYNCFEQWLPNKSRGGFFNGARDSFNFDKDIITFDATYLLDQPEILPNVTEYMFHQIMAQVSASVVPHILFFDESPRYFQDEIFAKVMIEKLNEERKKAGVVILAAQNPQQYMKLPKGVGSEIISALAHIICYPNSNATKEQYCDFLGFNETEFEWIKNTSIKSRKVMIKNKSTGSSVVVDVDLSSLNGSKYNLLECFNSSQKAISTLKQYQKESPEHWRTKYLRNP